MQTALIIFGALWICGAALLAVSMLANRWARSHGLKFKKNGDGKTLLTMETEERSQI